MLLIIGGIVGAVVFFYFYGKHSENYQKYEKPRKWLMKSRDVFNGLQKRFYKCGYPITDYLEALSNAYNNGLKKLSDKELNFYLSYPKKYKYDEKTKHIIVNDVDLGLANECVLFDKMGSNFWTDKDKNFVSDNVYEKLLGKEFYINSFEINSDYTGILGEYASINDDDSSCKNRLTKVIDRDFKNIESESKKYLDLIGKNNLSSEVNILLENLSKEDDFNKMKDLVKGFSDKARNEYFNKKEEKEFLSDMKDENVFGRLYGKGIEHPRDTEITKIDNDSLEFSRDQSKSMQLSDMYYNQVSLEKKYANILSDIELRYNMNEKTKERV